jgi:hypothetical protein
VIEIRKGQAPALLGRAAFSNRFRDAYFDPISLDQSIVGWRCLADYQVGRKAPITQKAGPGYADPDYDLSVEWVATKLRIDEAQRRWADAKSPSRVLLICGSARNDGTCPGEISKSFRLLAMAREILQQADIEVDVLDLSLLTSEYGETFIRARAACRRQCRCAIGRAVVTRITRSIKPMTGWRRFTNGGRPRTR